MIPSTTGDSKPTLTYFDVPATNSSDTLLRELEYGGSYGGEKERGRDVLKILYPKLDFFDKPTRLRQGLLVIRQEYIVVGEVYMDYSFLVEGETFLLKNADGSFQKQVNVLKNRRCGRMARPIILLGTVVKDDSLEDLTDVAEVLQVTQIGKNILGEIHPGKSNGAGSSAGYSNAYGHSRPVLPDTFRELFRSANPEPFPAVSQSLSPTVPVKPPAQNRGVFYVIARLLALLGPKKSVQSPKPVKIAILDTGLRQQGAGKGNNPGCDEVHTGWNFVSNTADLTDDHPARHGTRIEAITKQEAPSSVCLPVKTAGATGVCELYDVLCGLEYARVNGADIVNASFSFSINESPDEAIPLLHNLISVLENEGIWIVAAAGNASQYAPSSGTGVLLEEPLLYPACYSRADNYDRVLTVTTVSKNHLDSEAVPTFGLNECYSPTYVDVGIIANSHSETNASDTDNSFTAPGFPPQPGTSYATAYMSGLVAKALATQYIDGKMELLAAARPQTKPELAFGIRTQESIPV